VVGQGNRVGVVYDAGVLIAAERGKREVWADHEALLERGVRPWTTAPVLAQVSRSPTQALLRRLLRGCHVAPFESSQAHAVGMLLSRAAASDVVDAHVMITAASHGATVLSSDADDLARLAAHLPTPVRVQLL
jgi:predicted nucleic acid-binding protein